jgi:hypothetical protein
MSLNIDEMKFYIERIRESDQSTFSDLVTQLFNYLETNVSENSVYLEYEAERENWAHWSRPSWKLPKELHETKSLSYDLYKSVVDLDDEGYRVPFNLFLRTIANVDEAIDKFNDTFLPYFEKVLDDILDAEGELAPNFEEHIIGDKIFIIHGHDNEMKKEVQLLLNRAGLDDVVLHECPDKGRTIIEKLLDESTSACYAIALLSRDDKLADGKTRTRQNVILEIGYFLGMLGKERVRLLKKGDIEIPSDLQGILYTPFDSTGSWRIQLLKEMKAVDIEVDVDEVINKF